MTTTTFTISASIGSTPSDYVTDPGAVDFEVTIDCGPCAVECETTLIPGEQTGELAEWGDLEHWLSAAGRHLYSRLSESDSIGARDLLQAIVDACTTGDEIEVEVECDPIVVLALGVSR
jgi:hypothetical protein